MKEEEEKQGQEIRERMKREKAEHLGRVARDGGGSKRKRITDEVAKRTRGRLGCGIDR